MSARLLPLQAFLPSIQTACHALRAAAAGSSVRTDPDDVNSRGTTSGLLPDNFLKAAVVVSTLLAMSIPAPAQDAAGEPLHAVINRELAPPGGVVWPKASDEEFLRRVSLDMNGMPPGADEARAFLTDSHPQKREKLIDRLLASPLYDRHLATVLDVMLMERRPNTHVPQDLWMSWLLTSVRENKPWNTLVRELLTADGEAPEHRAPARFYLDRSAEPHVIARDVGRIFFGRDIQCSQCHDSPLVSDFLQRDYQGLLAFVSAGYPVTRKVDNKDVTIMAERAPADVTFESVFNKGSGHRTSAMLFGSPAIAEPFYLPGEDYLVAPADGVRSVPKYSRRAMLAELATSGTNRYFNENIANRLWALMLGRGLVQPLDMMHSDNPSASPALTKILGERIAASGFDIKSFLREIALSDVYQRPFDMTPDVIRSLAESRSEQQLVAQQKDPLAAEARDLGSVRSEADSVFDEQEASLLPAAAEVDKTRTAYAEVRKKLDEAQKAFRDATAALESKKAVAETLHGALVSLQSASSALGNDPQLAEALNALADRTTKISAELPTLQKAVDEKTAVVKPASDAVAAAKLPLEAAVAAMKPLQDALLAAEQKVVSTRESFNRAQLAATSAEVRLAALTNLVAAADASAAVQSSESQVVSLEAAVNAANQSVIEFGPTVDERLKALQGAEVALAAAKSAVSMAQEQVSACRAVESPLAAAVESLKNAQAMLPTDAAVRESLTTLDARAEAIRSRLTSAEQQLVSASQMLSAADQKMAMSQNAMAEATAEKQKRQQAASQSGAMLDQSKEQLVTSRENLERSLEPVPTDLANRFALSHLKPLTPEQMCWAVFRVTTVYDRYVAQETAELDKTSPPTEVQKADPAFLKSRAIEIEQRVFNKLSGNVGSYVQIYGGAPGQPQNDFYASPDQALFTLNGGGINGWVVPAGDNPAERIIKAADPRVAAEELYLGILTRMPTESEVNEVTQFLGARTDKSRAAQELVWGLLSSAEFRFNR
ncbi:MAG: DUF1549 domain-containing protein [Planctomycetota bacterium]